jgi:hypothetical protein
MMVKIGVIFMSFSNPTCQFRHTADFTRRKTVGGKVSCILIANPLNYGQIGCATYLVDPKGIPGFSSNFQYGSLS